MTDDTNLQVFVAAVRTGTPQAAFAALDGLIRQRVGARLVSCSVFDLTTAQARRVYTDNAEIYPLSGLKDVTPNAWTRHVIDGRKTFVATTIDDMRPLFPDHETIESLGLGSIINLPVELAGTFLGTVNMLDRDGAYGDEQVAAAETLRLPAMAAFASLLLSEAKL